MILQNNKDRRDIPPAPIEKTAITSGVKFPNDVTSGTLLIWIDIATSRPSVVKHPARRNPVTNTFFLLKIQIL